MKLYNSSDPQVKPSVVMLVYGDGGVGKTTFASTAPAPLLADCENGAKYFGLRGIKDIKIANIERWSDMRDFINEVSKPEYQTVVIDPVGELMEKLKRHMVALGDKKLVQNDGSPSMAGWGWLKATLRDYIKALRDLGKHVILVAHVEEKDDEGRLVKRPKVETKLSAELVNLVDIVAFMEVVKDEGGEEKRILRVDPVSDKFIAKDRTGQLGKIIPPNFTHIVDAIHGNNSYAWLKANVTAPAAPAATAPATTPAVEPEPTTAATGQAVPPPAADTDEPKLPAKVLAGYDKIHDALIGATPEGGKRDYSKIVPALQKLGLDVKELPVVYEQVRVLYTRMNMALKKKIG